MVCDSPQRSEDPGRTFKPVLRPWMASVRIVGRLGHRPPTLWIFWVNGFFCTGFMKYFDFPSLFMSVPAEVINEKVKQYVKGGKISQTYEQEFQT